MQNIIDFYILGLPIDTSIGKCNFIKVKEYPDLSPYFNYILLTKQHIINLLNENKTNEIDYSFIQDCSLFTIINIFSDIRQMYQYLFSYLFQDENVFDKIDDNSFDYYRKLILDMNAIKEEKINPNPEIQKWIERSKRFKQIGQEQLTFADMVSSIVGFNGLTYTDINEMTIYQFNYTFQRIAKIKSYDTSTLFSTVSTEKINIEQWFGHIDLLQEDSHGISREEFDQKSNSLFN